MKTFLPSILILFFLIASCKQSNRIYKPDSLGIFSEVAVVVNDTLYKDYIGPALMDSAVFGREFEGIFFPPEFKLVTKNVTPARYKKYKGSRNLLVFKKGIPEVQFYTDSFAIPQSFVVIKGNSVEDYTNAIQFYKDSLVDVFVDADRRYVVETNKDKDLKNKPFLDSLGLNMLIPESFLNIKKEKDFTWYRKDKQEDILNLMFYTLPSNDSISAQNLIQIRDIYNKRHVGGTREGDFSMTDTIVIPTIDTIISSPKKDVIQIKGNWSMAKDMMGGPFITKIINDKENNQLYFADVFIFAPNVDFVNNNMSKKRNYLIQLDGLLTTFDFK